MTHEKLLVKRGKELSFLLRHDKEYTFNEHGWRTVEDLVVNHNYTLELIEEIVATNNKSRYEFNENHTLIRARQGHSIDVDVELKEVVPTMEFLYHGTDYDTSKITTKEGIKPQSRLYVHLSADKSIAFDVAKRHCSGGKKEAVALAIDVQSMVADGIAFFLSNNGVWLTKYVDPKYIIIRERENDIVPDNKWNRYVTAKNKQILALSNQDEQRKLISQALLELRGLNKTNPGEYPWVLIANWYVSMQRVCGFVYVDEFSCLYP